MDRIEMRSTKDRGGVFTELEAYSVNPRELHRKIIMEVEDLGYFVKRGVDEELVIAKEALGDYTGTLRSRIEGKKAPAAPASIEYRAISKKVIVVATLILVLGLFGLLYSYSGFDKQYLYPSYLAVAFAIFITLAAWIKSSHTDTFYVLPQSGVSILVEGEVCEKTEDRDGTRTSELLANALVSASALTDICVDPAGLPKQAILAIIRVEPNALLRHRYDTSGLRHLLPEKTNEILVQENATAKQNFEKIVKKLSEFATEHKPSS